MALDIEPDEENPVATLTVTATDGSDLAQVRVKPDHQLSRGSAQRWADAGSARRLGRALACPLWQVAKGPLSPVSRACSVPLPPAKHWPRLSMMVSHRVDSHEDDSFSKGLSTSNHAGCVRP
jgi:hypothetical protein